MTDDSLKTASRLTENDVVTAASLAGMDGIRHAFFTRRGGVSGGIYAGLNMGIGSKDDAEAVAENRARGLHYLGLSAPDIVTPWQTHSADAVVVTEPFGAERPKADGIVTATPGLAIGVVTADCGPILFADPVARVVGAAHAGWQGAVSGVLEATIAAMERCGAQRTDIVAVLGPTITQAHYEVGEERRDAVLGFSPDAGRFFAAGDRPGKQMFDLPGYIVERLERTGVSAGFVGRCTYGEEDAFFSFRRTTHRGEQDYGRQLAAIAIDA